jgi:hypothetical protein
MLASESTLLPVQKTSSNVAKVLISTALFFTAMLIMTILCTVLWDTWLNGKVYGCPDGGTCDYWLLSWAAIGNGNYPAVTVDRIHISSMSDPDQLKTGWSVVRLWVIWFSFFGGSLLVSFLLASLPWSRRLELRTIRSAA